MKKKVLFLILFSLWLMPISLMAKHVTEAQAYAAAASFFESNNRKAGATLCSQAAQTSVEFNELYIFCGTNNHGFVIVSADDCAKPIVGYSYDSPFDPDAMPPQFVWWLQRYEQAIRQSRTLAEAKMQPHPDWAALLDSKGTKDGRQPVVPPLITTTWDQYNRNGIRPTYEKFCPYAGNYIYAKVGCVAVACAQIMKYWSHPSTGWGSETYTIREHDEYGGSYVFGNWQLSADFGSTHYDWDNMPPYLDSYSSDTEIDAVATLLYHVGVAVHMTYDVVESAAVSETVEDALVQHFKYSNALQILREHQYTMEEWKTLLKGELDEGRPVYYSGSITGHNIGHAFVCDGYDNCDYFHFNWGWGGSQDGYFNIEPPYQIFIGDTALESAFMYYEGCKAIIGIEPYTGVMPPENGITEMSVIPNRADFGTTTGSGIYQNYSMVNMTATHLPGYRFVRWNDGYRSSSRWCMAYGGMERYTAYFEEDLDNNLFGYEGGLSYQTTYFDKTATRIDPSALGRITALNGVRFYSNRAAESNITLEIKSGGSNPSNATPILTLSYTHLSVHPTGWDSIIFDNPLSVNTTEPLWIIIQGGAYCEYINTELPSSTYWLYSNNEWAPAYWRSRIQAITTLAVHDPVQNLQTAPREGNVVRLSWDAPTTSAPTAYTLAIGTSDDPYSMPTFNTVNTWYDLTMDESITAYSNITISDLMQNNTYHAFVRASYTNSYGQEYHSRWTKVSFNHVFNDDDWVVINVVANDESLGYVTGGGIYRRWSSVRLDAIPLMGSRFVRWDDNEYILPRPVTARENRTYTAIFEAITAELSPTYNPSQGTIEIDGETVLSGQLYQYPILSTLEAKAVPNTGYRFEQWGDGVTNNPRYISLKNDIDNPSYYLTALFTSDPDSKNYHLSTRHNKVDIHTDQPLQLQVFDMLGRCVHSGQSEAESTTTLTLDRKGVYLIKVGENEAEKIIIL